jgi:hypothetical protein
MSQSYQSSQSQGGQMVSSQPQGVSGGAIPDLLKIGAIPSNTQIEVESAVLEPVTHSDTHCKFVLQNKGLLHSHSKIEFEFTTSATSASAGMSLPIGVGIHSLIERATLRVGTKTICEVEDYNMFQAYQSQFLSPEAEIEREQYLSGRVANSLAPTYTDRQVAVGGVSNEYIYGTSLQSNTSADGLLVANGKDMDVSITAPNVGSGAVRDVLDESRLCRRRAGVYNQSLAPTWQVALSDLFPFLKTNQLPLYMMKEPVNLEMVFSSAGLSTGDLCERACGNTASNPVINVRTASTRMIADHLYYPQEMMDAYAQANRSLQFQYMDYRMSKFSVDAGSLASQGIRNIGGAGRIVSKVFWGISDTDYDSAKVQNKYVALSPARTYTQGTPWTGNNNQVATFNLKMNEQFLFPIDVKNSSRHFHNVVQTEGMVPFCSREVYSKEGVSLSLAQYDDQVMDAADMWGSGSITTGQDTPATRGVGGQGPGTQFWCAMRLNRGERINSRGMELYFQGGTAFPIVGNGVQRVWLETLRTAVLQDGEMTCYYA